MEKQNMTDNQESPSKELLEKPRCHGKPEVMRKQYQHLKDIGFGDKLKIKEIFVDEYQESPSKEFDASKRGDLILEEIVSTIYYLNKGSPDSYRLEMFVRAQAKQLAATQQALDSSCQTNQILVKRLKIAEEALEDILVNKNYCGSDGSYITHVVQKTLDKINGK